ncbi:MAG: PEP-utilizing enzyme [Caldilineaceae bacterium]
MSESMPEPMSFTPLPVPPDFPVTWDHPHDAYLLWTRDRTHWPEQITPLEFSLWQHAAEGMNAAYEFYAMLNKTKLCRFNTYYYNAMIFEMLAPAEMEERGKAAEAKIGNAMAHLGELWQTEWLPEIKRHLVFWEAVDLPQATMPALLDHLEETIDRTVRLWDIHNRILLPMALAMSLFDDFYQDLFDEATPFGAYQLLEGFTNKTVESGLALWTLSRQALGAPDVVAALHAQTADAALAALATTTAGQSFLTALQDYLQAFGQRGDKWGWQYPSWLEDPAPVIHNLQDYITQPDRDLTAEMTALTAKREARITEARAQIANYPQPMIQQFEFLLKAAQAGAVIKEDHTYWLDFCTSYHVRQVLLTFGERFAAAGAIAQPDDVFYLTLPELEETARQRPTLTRQALVAERQAEMAHFAHVAPPKALGAMPATSILTDPKMAQNPLLRLFTKLDGGMTKPAQEAGTINGNAGAPGKCQGVARVIRTLKEAKRLQPGEILVTETTAPPWTPLFATAAAVVTETGGILCHSAVVAREYGIPAVVGADGAMTQIQDGQQIEVDGDRGTVRILAAGDR